MGTSKHKWRFNLLKSPSKLSSPSSPPPPEFICPISNNLMADPVIVSSGQTFERSCVLACISLSFKPNSVDFNTIIPNLALKSAILNWCHTNSYTPFPQPLDIQTALSIVKSKVNNDPVVVRLSSCLSSTSEDSIVAGASAGTSGECFVVPYVYSSSSSSEIDNPVQEDDEICCMLRSGLMSDQENGVVTLRNITRTRQESRVGLCSTRLLSGLRHLIVSRYLSVQVNAVAALVNLSLENDNKVKIVRSGIVPPLIEVLRGGFPEAQDHAAGALFSLALDDQNKTAIGVLGALPPLLHALRAGSDRCRHDSALALYHLSLVQSNRSKLVKLGSVQLFLNMVKSGHMTGRVMLVLCNLAGSAEGQAAMLDGGAVECLLGLLSRGEFDSDQSTRECCLGALYGLSQGGLRFKGLAKEAGAEELLVKEEEMGTVRCKEKAKKILEVMRQKYEEEETVDWEALLKTDEVTRSRFELVYGKG